MRGKTARILVAIGCVAAALLAAAPAQGTVSDPLFVFVPSPKTLPPTPPPNGTLSGPCGMGVDPSGSFYVSDYYHDTVDAYGPDANYNPQPPDPPPTGATGYLGQLAGIDAIDGPCGLSFDAAGHLYVNDYHRAVLRYGHVGSFGAATTITGGALVDTHPTGVAVDPATGYVYVDQRTYVEVFDELGTALGKIGEGSLQDGYAIALSQYPATQGYLYVPDAASDTVKVYDPATDTDNPIEEIDAADTPNGEFVSLRDASIAVDRVTGEIYVIDNLQPADAERPQAVVYVFSSTGAYEGHLKFLVTDGMPAGLAVDNTETATQGRVYVTSGNTALGAIYAYGPGAATTAPIKLATASLALASSGSGGGSVQSSLSQSGCSSSCEEEIPAGATVTLSAEPEPGSAFAGWSGACGGGDPTCSIRLEEATSVRATFSEEAGPQAPPERSPSMTSSAATPTTFNHARNRKKNHHRRHRAHRAHRRGVERGR